MYRGVARYLKALRSHATPLASGAGPLAASPPAGGQPLYPWQILGSSQQGGQPALTNSGTRRTQHGPAAACSRLPPRDMRTETEPRVTPSAFVAWPLDAAGLNDLVGELSVRSEEVSLALGDPSRSREDLRRKDVPSPDGGPARSALRDPAHPRPWRPDVRPLHRRTRLTLQRRVDPLSSTYRHTRPSYTPADGGRVARLKRCCRAWSLDQSPVRLLGSDDQRRRADFGGVEGPFGDFGL